MDNYFFLLSNGVKLVAENSNLEELLYSNMVQIVDSMYIISLDRLKDSAEVSASPNFVHLKLASNQK